MNIETRKKIAAIEHQLELINELRGCDHGFISAVGVRYFLEPFGIEGGYEAHVAAPDQPKGLVLHDSSAAGAIGQDAAVVAELIAQKLGCHHTGTRGRGFRLRAAIHSAEHFLKKQLRDLDPETVEPEDQSEGDPDCERGA